MGQKVCRIRSVWHGFRDTSIFVFCDFCKKLENSKWLPFLAGQKFFENWVTHSVELPCGSKISSKSLYLARFSQIQAFLCFALLKKNLKIQNFWSCDLSDWLKCHRSIFRKISQGYCIHLPNLKGIRRTVTELSGKENAELTEPAEPDILPYTNKRPLRDV